jgi:flagellar hook-associated protein FlgK
MLGLSTGLSALRVSQRALDIVGQNIANANTPGYHRQVLNLATRLPVELDGQSIGTGVQITDVRRLRSGLIENALVQHASDSGDIATQLEALRHVETLLSTGDGSVHNLLEKFFNGLEQLSTRPGDMTLRRVVLGTAAALSDEFNYVAGEMDRSRQNVNLQLSSAVGQINSLAKQIAGLNEAIQRSAARGINANDLLDQREQLVKQIAEFMPVRVVDAQQDQVSIFLEGAPLVISNRANTLSLASDAEGNAIVTAAGLPDPLNINSGKLGGMLQIHNTTIPEYQDRIDTLAREFIRAINGVHATGLGLDGPFTLLAGMQPVNDAGIPLAQAGLTLPPSAGSLFVTVTDLATGQRTISEIAVNPATQSLNDVANAISAVTGLLATVDPQSQLLTVRAQAGYGFDFAGQLESAPSSMNVTGTSQPAVAGRYTGTTNDTYTFEVVGSGIVGVTPGLKLDVKNSAGAVIGTFNIGQGYEPGQAIQAVNGLSVQLSAGTVNNGDDFTARVIAQPDTSGVLVALGLGGLFVGSDSRSIRLNGEVLLDPARLATSQTGLPGDTSNLDRLVAVRDKLLLSGGTQTLRDGYAAIATDVGAAVQNLSERQDHQELLGLRLEAERQSVSGVDANEELVRMVQFQRSFQMAAKYINVVSQTLDELTQII